MEREPIAKVEYRTITSCRSCESPAVQDVLSLGKHQLPGFKDGVNSPEVPLTLCVCPDCSLVQLRHTTDPALLWNDGYGYRSGVNTTMRDHLKGIVDAIDKRITLQDDDIVLDIGCNDGTMLGFYRQDIRRVGFDPSENVLRYAHHDLKGKRARLFLDYFNKELYLPAFGERAKVITAISMFYDLDDPNKFLADVKDVLDPKGIFVIEQNYLKGMVENTAFDNICHEHLEYYSLYSLEMLLSRHDLEVFDAQETQINGGAFRTYICHKGAGVRTNGGFDRVSQMRKAEKFLTDTQTYTDFAERVKEKTKKIGDFIRGEFAKGKIIYAYGASTRGGTLLQACGLDGMYVRWAVERNPDKVGKIMEATGIPIMSEDEARRNQPDYMIVLPWFFAGEFYEREKEYLTKGGKFIIPLPEPGVVTYDNGHYTFSSF